MCIIFATGVLYRGNLAVQLSRCLALSLRIHGKLITKSINPLQRAPEKSSKFGTERTAEIYAME